MTMKKGPLKQQVQLLDRWKDTPIGTLVVVKRDNGDLFATRTRSAPWMLGQDGNGKGGHTAVIMVEGISGCYALERVQLA
jgi:hypothetical protein